MNIENVLSELMNVETYTNLQQHYMILLFYFLVIFVTSTVGHVMDKKDGFMYGLIIGFVVSLVLWYQYGRNMVY